MELEGSYCRDELDFGMMCFCGEVAPLCKSKSKPNPGRRFFECSNYMNEEYCRFFCWYDPPPNSTKRKGLRPMKVWKVREMGKASEQAESSSTPLKKNEEQWHIEGNAMQMKIDAMHEEIQKLKVPNPVKQGISKWKVLFYGFLGWLMYYLCTSFGKGNQLALP
ncbi:hypothetical protein Vadar_019764 [Vaccinium darrowii]|uniref:Uncharacterized protein n=1 Tax=Vaccinium darrowii TaxID=229202 RepID=A0ACB7X216_9ERIC|nr:hypothetical protein Vadar_019764 [Vaccinium darrowii]